MRIVFVRHGDPDYAHDCLTEKGLIQAKQAAVRLREEGIEEIWSSPMGRAQQTAAAAEWRTALTCRVLFIPRPGKSILTYNTDGEL